MAEPRILFIDDDETAREVARYNLTRAGFGVDVAATGEEGIAAFSPEAHPVVVTDLRLPGVDGLGVLTALRARSPEVAVVVVTAYGDVETAVRAMRQGAYDFIPKPFNRDQLQLTVSRALERAGLLRENRRLTQAARGIERPIVYASPAMADCLAVVDRVARTASTVLLTGESGTGKELVARRLHARSPRGAGAFVAVNCAAIPAELVESELFGHEAGTFTGAHRRRKGRFAQADGGTLFLDEVSELSLPLQGKLLRALQEGEIDPLGSEAPVKVDVRVVAASNQDLMARVERGELREDLYYRLAVVEIPLPPLRERPEDVPLLARHLLAQAAEGRELTLPGEVLDALLAWEWPGNVRELANACERLAVLCPGDTVRLSDLPRAVAAGPTHPQSPAPAPGGIDAWLDQRPRALGLFDLERLVIEHALRAHDGNLSAAARSLGVPRHILVYRVEKFGVRR